MMRKLRNSFGKALIVAGVAFASTTCLEISPVYAEPPAFANDGTGVYAENQAVLSMFEAISGKWVDANGHRCVNFANEKLNNNRITSVYNLRGNVLNGSGEMTIIDTYDTRKMPISWSTNDSGVKTVVIQDEKGNGITFHKAVEDTTHYESVGGITLDMSIAQMKVLYGGICVPLTADETYKQCGIRNRALKLKNGVILTYDEISYTIDRIIITKNTSNVFDRTVLGCNSPLDRYSGLYGWRDVPDTNSNIDLGNGEIMDFTHYPNAMVLRLADAR